MNWWANRLAQGGQAPPPPPVTQSYERPRLPAPVQQPTKAASQRQEIAQCPGCGSGDYMASPGTSYKRCFDCGYPIVQSGTGVGATKADGPVQKAVQVPSGSFSPQTIVGRVE